MVIEYATWDYRCAGEVLAELVWIFGVRPQHRIARQAHTYL